MTNTNKFLRWLSIVFFSLGSNFAFSQRTESLLLDRMILAVEETAHYSQRQCEAYLTLVHFLFPEEKSPLPTRETWLDSRAFFRDDMVILAEIRSTTFSQELQNEIPKKWGLVQEARKNPDSPISKIFYRWEEKDLRILTQEVVTIQHMRNLRVKIDSLDHWLETLRVKHQNRFYDNTTQYISLQPL